MSEEERSALVERYREEIERLERERDHSGANRKRMELHRRLMETGADER